MKSEHYADAGVRLIRLQNIETGRFDDEDQAFVPEEHFQALPGHEARPGDLLIAGLGDSNHPLARACLLPAHIPVAMVKADCFRFRLDQTQLRHRFVTYFLASSAARPVVDSEVRGATRSRINLSGVGRVLVPLPSVSQQDTIADFLDRKTSAIDALIEKKERLIAEAEERRATLIRDVVLGSLSTAKRRASETPLGSLPEHWTAKRLMYLTAAGRPIMYGIVLPGPNVDEGVPIIKSGNCTRGTLRPDLLHKTTFEIDAGYERSRVAKDDIVYAIRGSVGMATLVPEEVAGANLTQDAARIAPASGVNARWLLFAIQSAPVWAQLAAGIVGATVKGINIRDLKRPFVPVPPRHEQDEIAAYLDAEIGRLHELEAATTRSIDRLREYRQALITAAVTGQIDVTREAA